MGLAMMRSAAFSDVGTLSLDRFPGLLYKLWFVLALVFRNLLRRIELEKHEKQKRKQWRNV